MAQIAAEDDGSRRVKLLAKLAALLHSMTALVQEIVLEQFDGNFGADAQFAAGNDRHIGSEYQ